MDNLQSPAVFVTIKKLTEKCCAFVLPYFGHKKSTPKLVWPNRFRTLPLAGNKILIFINQVFQVCQFAPMEHHIHVHSSFLLILYSV